VLFIPKAEKHRTLSSRDRARCESSDPRRGDARLDFQYQLGLHGNAVVKSPTRLIPAANSRPLGSSAGVIIFSNDGLNPVQELSGSNAVSATMLTGPNIDEYFQRTEPGCCGPLSYLTDALGSTLALTDSHGAIQNQYQYEPFGNTGTPIFNNTSTNTYQFTGRENDGEIGYDLY
jgi:hypothetical protein